MGRLSIILAGALVVGCTSDRNGTSGASLDGGQSPGGQGGSGAAGGGGGGGFGAGGVAGIGGDSGGGGVSGTSGTTRPPPAVAADLDVASIGEAILDGMSDELTAPSNVDLLVVIDNSVSMADKQGVFAETLATLVGGLIDNSNVTDLHVGVITSSLGGFGSDLCTDESSGSNDRGRLVARSFDGSPVPTYDDMGFLKWDPNALASPTGLSDRDLLLSRLRQLVLGAGELGCGFEATLESWFRFLADPNPPAEVVVGPCSAGNSNPCATPTGEDSVLLAQRAAFLRSDSVLGILMLSDENDCSMQNTGQLYYAARQDISLPRASSTCDVDPDDACCYSCAVGPPSGCATDPVCSMPLLDPGEDPLNLRCFQQKRRFGIDFLYPTTRYVNALTEAMLCPDRADLSVEAGCAAPVANPLSRDPARIVLAGVVGVPYQDVTVPEASGLRFQTATELESSGKWDVILGDITQNAPSDPLMIESILPRSGSSFAAGPMAPPDSPPFTNEANSHEWANPSRDDLQYACIFPVAEPRDCDDPAFQEVGCNCRGVTSGAQAGFKPVCQDPQTGEYSSVQHFAKAYPGQRILQVLKDFGPNAVVTSICPPPR